MRKSSVLEHSKNDFDNFRKPSHIHHHDIKEAFKERITKGEDSFSHYEKVRRNIHALLFFIFITAIIAIIYLLKQFNYL